MRRLTLAFAVAFAIAAIGLSTACGRFFGLGGGNEGKPDVDVELSMQPDPDNPSAKICTVTKAKTDKLGGDSDKNKNITWHVTNVDCLVPQYVAFDEYRDPPTTNGSVVHDVVDQDHSETSSPVTTSDKNAFVRAKIIKEIHKPNPHKVYKYRICWGPLSNPTDPKSCWDPDIDVWPF